MTKPKIPDRWILRDVPLERSFPLRYYPLIPEIAGVPRPTRAELRRCSAGREGIVARRLKSYKDVEIDLFDLSSAALTGTVKSASGCLITAACLHAGVEELMVLSSGNKANSLRAYALRQGLSVISMIPRESAAKLRGVPERAPGARDVVVLCDADSDEEMKILGRRAARLMGIHCQPVLSYYECADRLRAAAYAEHLETHAPATHFYQAVSSNYGLYGTYRGIEDLASRGELAPPFPIPVGVQQSAVSPLYDVFEAGVSPEAAFAKARGLYRGGEVFERTLFTTSPATLPENEWLRKNYGARFATVSRARFSARYAEARAMLGAAGVELPAVEAELGEKTGALCLVAVLDGVDSGLLAPGARVLLHFTGGLERLPAFEPKTSLVIPWPASRGADELARTLRLALAGEKPRGR